MIRCPNCNSVMHCKRAKVNLNGKTHHVTACRCKGCGFDARKNLR